MPKNRHSCLLVALLLIAAAGLQQTNANNQVAGRKLRSVYEYQQRRPSVMVHNQESESELIAGNLQNFENVCDVQNPVAMYCYCDSLEPKDAITASCWLFSQTRAEDVLWESFRSQPHLTELHIGLREHGHLEFIPTKALAHLPKLETADVKYANISVVGAFAFANLSKLHDLSLIHNQILTLEPQAFADLIMLKVLTLSWNNISEINRQVFVNLPRLNELHLKENKITILHDGAFRDLAELEELYMHNNQIGVITGDTFIGLKSLRKLDLHNNLIQILGDFTFVEVPELVELDLKGNRIQYVRDNALFGLEKLETIHLQENNLVQLGEMIFESTRNLRYIDLRNNRLDTLAEETWTPLWKNPSTFVQIGLENNNFFCDCRVYWMVRLYSETTDNILKGALGNLTCDDGRNFITAVSNRSSACLPKPSSTGVPTHAEILTSTGKPNKFSRTRIPPMSKATTEAPFVLTHIVEEDVINKSSKSQQVNHINPEQQDQHVTKSGPTEKSHSILPNKNSVPAMEQVEPRNRSSSPVQPACWLLLATMFFPWMLLHLDLKRTL